MTLVVRTIENEKFAVQKNRYQSSEHRGVFSPKIVVSFLLRSIILGLLFLANSNSNIV